MRTTLAVLIVLPTMVFSQFSARLSYSQGDPTYRWVNSSESVDLSILYATSDQWRIGATLAWQYLALHSTGNQAIMTPLTISGRYYTSSAGTRGYFEGFAGIVRRYYQYLIYSEFSSGDGQDFVSRNSSIHYAPLYGVGVGLAVPVVPDLDLNLGVQIDVSPKGFRRSNKDFHLSDGFSQTRALIALEYSL